ncbi:MAG TPA: glycolate oxidase subunit GlcF [Caulobacteraceae bacterium]|jgi:glycolate oxidase iron-sulfur subunit
MRTQIQSPLAETAAGAVAESVLRACVHCGMCNAACPTYQLTGDELDGPRGRIYLMKQALEGEAAGGLTRHHLDRCLGCRACETACPSGVEYHRLLDVGRAVGTGRRPWNQRLARWAIRRLTLSPNLLSGLFALGRAVRFALPRAVREAIPPNVPAGPWPRPANTRRMLLLGGCVQSAAARRFNAATARVFDHCGVSLTESGGCCGAVSFHLDAHDEARALARGHIDAWSAALANGAEAVVVNASGCAAFIRDWPDLLSEDPAYAAKARAIVARLRDPVEILADLTLAPRRAPAHRKIAVHDPCTLANGPGLAGAPARLLESLGYEPVPVAGEPLCCGSAGAYSLLQPGFARRLRTQKLAALTAGAPETIYTGNIGCWMHLGAVADVPVRHWIEAVDDLIS